VAAAAAPAAAGGGTRNGGNGRAGSAAVGLGPFERRHEFVPQRPQHAERHERSSRDLRRQRAERERRAPQSPELVTEGLDRERMPRCRLGRLRGSDRAGAAFGRPGRDPHDVAHGGRDVEIDRLAAGRQVARERAAQPGREPGVVGLPDRLARPDRGEIDRPARECQLDAARRHRFGHRPAPMKNLVDAAAGRLVAGHA
jgi:hypothetical protein